MTLVVPYRKFHVIFFCDGNNPQAGDATGRPEHRASYDLTRATAWDGFQASCGGLTARTTQRGTHIFFTTSGSQIYRHYSGLRIYTTSLHPWASSIVVVVCFDRSEGVETNNTVDASLKRSFASTVTQTRVGGGPVGCGKNMQRQHSAQAATKKRMLERELTGA